MEVTRQLRKDKLTKAGLAPIHLTFWWNNQRLRIASGEKCLPKNWNEKRQQVKNNPGAFADEINTVLDRFTQAAEAAHLADRQVGLVRSVPDMEAEIRRRYAELARSGDEIKEVAPPPLPAPPPGLLDYMDQWIAEQSRKVSLRSGQSLSKSYLTSLARTRTVLADFYAQLQPDRVLRFDDIDRAFYTRFQDYVLTRQGKDVNTFGKYVRQLKTFLAWAEDHDLGVSGKYRRFETPSHYVGADALTQDELLALAAVDFRTEAARAYVRSAFAAEFAAAPDRPRVNGSRLSQVDELRVTERLRMLERSRDKLLQCCYFGLRISDADRLAPSHLRGDLVRITAGKTQVLCLIPYFDDDVFKPVALVQKYADQGLATCLPVVLHLGRYLPHVARLAGITRLALTSKIGRKTFATLKIYQGVPKSQVMLATGHKTETSFNRYLGIDEAELVDNFRKTARRVAEKGGGLEASAA